jgi:hypothetical protein
VWPPPEDDMEAPLIALGILAAMWILVLWGSIYFNKNCQ